MNHKVVSSVNVFFQKSTNSIFTWAEGTDPLFAKKVEKVYPKNNELTEEIAEHFARLHFQPQFNLSELVHRTTPV